ncbi:MAG: hypothetical protein GC168_10685 [Candidatus Hydrogenedens sp.]|nr:hypothetical protein [Candidatus Hydrogenedens sp.]
MADQTRVARWPYAVIAAYALLPMLVFLWVSRGALDGVFTGVHTGDSAHHLVAMRALESGFESPFATCRDPLGPQSWRYYAAPLFLLYAVVGEIGRLLGIPAFAWLGMADGIGAALYLLAVWRLLRIAVPDLAERAFLSFTLGGGLGGTAWLVCLALGWTHTPGFEASFMRFAQYELIEGQQLAPWTHVFRLYYTLPLALAFHALTLLVETDRLRCNQHLLFSAFVACAAAFLQSRVGLMVGLAGVLYCAAGSDAPRALRLRYATVFGAGVAAGGLAGYAVLLQHPAYLHNVSGVTRQVIEFLPLLYHTVWLWPAILVAGAALLRVPQRPLRVALGAAYGYLLLYALLCAGSMAYHDTWVDGGELPMAIRASDRALPGLLLGAIALWHAPRKSASLPPGVAWFALWAAAFLTLGLSAWGNGAMLTLSPQRFMVMLGLPLAVVAAYGLHRLRPAYATALTTLTVTCGITSLLVASAVFQGFTGMAPGRGPFAYLNYARVSAHDAEAIAALKPGTYLVPPWCPIAYGELLAQRPGVRVIGGPGTLNLGGQDFSDLMGEVRAYFDPSATDEYRQAFRERWCVDDVFLPEGYGESAKKP